MAAAASVFRLIARRRTSVSLLMLFGATYWKWYSMLALDSLGLIKPLFNMELITGLEKITTWREEVDDHSNI